MGIFALRARQAPPARPEARVELPEDLLAALPSGFAAVGEALASGTGTVDACAVTGRGLALEGISLDEALDGLEVASRLVRGATPRFEDARGMSVAWSEAMLGYLHRLTCSDPTTGLASLAHLQGRIVELYRSRSASASPVGGDYALVVLDTVRPDATPGPAAAEAFTADLRAARFAETVRSVFGAGAVLARVERHRIVVLEAREPGLPRRVAVVRRMLGDAEGGGRVWIEGLPDTESAARIALGELARR